MSPTQKRLSEVLVAPSPGLTMRMPFLWSVLLAGTLMIGACSKETAASPPPAAAPMEAPEPKTAQPLPTTHPEVPPAREPKGERPAAERMRARKIEASREAEERTTGAVRSAEAARVPKESRSAPKAEPAPPPGVPEITGDHREVTVFYATDRAEELFTFRAILHRLRWAFVVLLVVLAAPWLHRASLPRWERLAIAGICLCLGALGSQCGLLEVGALLAGIVVPVLVKPAVRLWFIVLCAIGCVVLTALSIRSTMLASALADRVGTAYGNSHRDDHSLAYGTCIVTIPKTHQVAVLESPSLTDFSESFERHIVLKVATPSSRDAWRDGFNSTGAKSAFVFIHGYNVSFEHAARRTAQIAHDLKFACTPILYSWRSAGGLEQYTRDENAADQTQYHLREFLEFIAASLKVEEIHLVAHSMGNRALCSVLAGIHTAQDKPRFHEIVLAAPDIDARVFRNDLAPRIVGNRVCHRITLYASSKDLALQASKGVHGDPRAGDSGDDLVVMDGIDTIDVTDLRSILLGHSYIGDNDSVLNDLRALLLEHAALAARTWLVSALLADKPYWRFSMPKPR